MDSTPPPKSSPVAAPKETVSHWRKSLWIVLAVLVVAPLVWLPGVILLAWFTDLVHFRVRDGVLIWVPIPVALAAAFGVTRRGLQRGWPGHPATLVRWGGAAAGVLALTMSFAVFLSNIKRSSADRSVLSRVRQIESAADQLFLECPYRIFVTFDDLVGEKRALKSLGPVEGYDYHALFPLRRDLNDSGSWKLILPDGRELCFSPRAEPPKTDGVEVLQLPGVGRLETTYRSGVPDGPFRAYYPDGKLWGEATYVKGKLVGPSWLYTRDGRKFDELVNGEAGEAALEASAKAGTAEVKMLAQQELKSGDDATAIADFTRALAIDPADLKLYRGRGDAKKASGDLDGAIADWCAAEGFTVENAAGGQQPGHLVAAFVERGRLRQAKGDAAGAARDFRVLVNAAAWRAEEHLRDRQYQQAINDLGPAIDLAPMAELPALRADAFLKLNALPSAEADYTRALELAAQGAMQIPANQHLMPAHWHYKRGHVRRWLGNLAGAAEDFRAALPALGTGGIINQGDAAAWLFLVQCEQGRRAEAVKELAALDKSGWWEVHRQLVQLLLGEITEAQLDAAVAKSNQDGDRLKASLYAGLLRRLAGDEAGALERFRAAVRYKDHDELPGEAARNALERR